MAKRAAGKAQPKQAHTTQEGSVQQVHGGTPPERDTDPRTGQGEPAKGGDGRHGGAKGSRDTLVSSELLRESGSDPRTRS
jgi:hypothetical protein